MHPTHITDVETTNNGVNNGKTNSISLNTAPTSPMKNGIYENGFKQQRENDNGNGNGSSRSNGSIKSTPQHNSNSNGIANGNGNGTTSNSNGDPEAYKNDVRRDSTQAWTPLLANGSISDSNGHTVDVTDDLSTTDVTPDTNGSIVNDQTVLYGASSARNNNDWKDAEEMNNLKNGFLNQHTQATQPLRPNNHHHQHQLNAHHHNHNHNHNLNHNHNNQHHQHHQHQHHGNNNGSLMNGKNGFGVAEKYDEQDPLTGLYKEKKKHSRSSDSEESDYDSVVCGGDDKAKQPSCGLFGCRPRWARRFASTHVFMVVFLLAYILQGMYMTYFVSVITTIEKLFQIKSRTTGFLLSASEMGQISTAMLLTYFAGRGHRPRWIACGMVLFSIAAFACSLPHFIFGKQLMQTSAFFNAQNNDQNSMMIMKGGEVGGGTGAGQFGLDALNASMMNFDGSTENSMFGFKSHEGNLCLKGSNTSLSSAECNEDRKLEQDSHSKITVIVLCIFFASLLSSGIGQTAVATLGIPYIDDNVASQKSAGYIAITIGVRILGPASGFIVGSICTRLYVNFSNPGYDASDPRWIGAWWLGPVMIGSLMMISSIAMFSFPKQLRGKSNSQQSHGSENCDNTTAQSNNSTNSPNPVEPEDKPRLRDFPKTVRRQLSNDILMFRTASCVFHLLPIAGLYTFLPKYLETQFRLATYDANMIAAFGGILVMGVGIVMSGLVILKIKPSARSVAAWIAFTALVYSAGMVILMFVGCSMNDFAGYNPGDNTSPAQIEPVCSAAINCTCDKESFAPICGQNGKIYISSCHAGCTTSEIRSSDNRTVFSNCACIPDVPDQLQSSYAAVSGYCDSNCKNFILFILIFAVCVFMHSTSEVGSMLLVMRCTHPKDKAMAMGVIQSAIGLFGNVPCPIIYGAVVDSACLVWKTVCGKHGACSLYDADTFRHYFLGITAGIMFLAFIMDLIVWSKAHRIDIAPEESNDKATANLNDKSAETECNRTISTTPTTTTPDTNV